MSALMPVLNLGIPALVGLGAGWSAWAGKGRVIGRSSPSSESSHINHSLLMLVPLRVSHKGLANAIGRSLCLSRSLNHDAMTLRMDCSISFFVIYVVPSFSVLGKRFLDSTSPAIPPAKTSFPRIHGATIQDHEPLYNLDSVEGSA